MKTLRTVRNSIHAAVVTTLLPFVFANPERAISGVPFPAELFDVQGNLGTARDGTFGTGLSIEGNTLVVGADREIDNRGAAYVFVRDQDQWREQARLVASDGANQDGFGVSVALSGDTVVVGALYDDTSSGSAYVFVRNGTNWTFQQKLVAPAGDRASLEYFGYSVGISGETIVVGAFGDNFSGTVTDSGAAYVFVRNGTIWTVQQKLLASDRATSDYFGNSVAIDGDRIIVGAPGNDDGFSSAGSAYVFQRTGSVWTQQIKLLANDPVVNARFGEVVALRGDIALVGSFHGVYVFTWNGASWSVPQKLISPHGVSVFAALGDNVVVASTGSDTNRAIGIFLRDGLNWVEASRIPVSTEFWDLAIEGETIVAGFVADFEGQTGPVLVYAPTHANASGVAARVRKFLYYPDAAASPGYSSNLAAFRYKHLLYGLETNRVRARHELMSSLYGPAERQLAQLAESELLEGLSFNPDNAALGNLLLDIYYCRTEAETILARNVLTQAEVARFGPPIAPNAPASGFIIDNEIPLQRQLLSTNRYAMQGYFDLLKRDLETWQPGGTNTRWATTVIGFSSQYTTGAWSAAQALGVPNTYPNYGDISTAWASVSNDSTREFLELGYDNPAPIHTVSIYETWHPGAVDKISVRSPGTGPWQEVWSGTAAPAGNTSRIFTVTFPLTTFPVNAVRIDINSPAVTNWNEIDAVSISGPGALVPVTDPTFGHRLFKTLVPGRGLMPATYTDTNGMNVVVTTNSMMLTNGMLFTGYKDLVLVFDLLRDYGRNAATLARLLAGRRNAGDLPEAQTIVSDAQRFLFLQGSLLRNMFSSLPPFGDPSGLAQAIDGWAETLYSLAELQQALATDANPLGFASDFLMLAENFFGVTNHFDSFDSFAQRLSAGSANSILLLASNALGAARSSYAQFRGYEDELATQLGDSSDSYEIRLFEIVGAAPGYPTYGDNPTNNPGSELDQQFRSIQVARLRILKNRTDISNLNKEVQIERQRASAVAGITVRYGNKQAELTQEIGDINAAQAAANQLTDYFNPENLLSGASIAIAINFGVQTIAELEKAKLQAAKEHLAALEQAEIIGAESAARVKTLLLRMSTLVLDSQEAGLLLNQEVARMAALYREKGELEKRLAEAHTDLASRYFADPIHRLSSQAAMIEANIAFEEARKWMFFMTRALEYKVNTPFTNNFLNRAWNSRSVFKVRNAAELVDLYHAMLDYNDTASHTRQGETSWFSIREDQLGYRAGVDGQGQPLLYLDPVTGERVLPIEAFRRHLRRNVRLLANDGAEIVLQFSTAREIVGENFFVGPTFDLDGNQVDAGAYLDKIDGLHLRVPGAHTLGRNDVTGRLTYGGTSFIRNPRVGTFDPARPDRLRNELTAYSTRYWFRDTVDLVWRFAEGFNSQVTLTLSTGPRMETTAEEIVVFKERSVAATGWVLTIRIRESAMQLLNIDEMTDVELLFRHSAIGRL